MDGLSSIAALLSLICLVVQTASGLHELCSKYKSSSRDVADLVSDIYALRNALENLKGLPLDACRVSTLSTLQYDVSKCNSDLAAWLEYLRNAAPDEDRGRLARTVKKVGAFINHDRFTELRGKVASHRAQLNLLLEYVGRDMDVQNNHELGLIRSSQLTNHKESTNALNSIINDLGDLRIGYDSLSGIDTRLQALQQMLMTCMPSMTQQDALPMPVHARRKRKRVNPMQVRTQKARCGKQMTSDTNYKAESTAAQAPPSPQHMRLIKTAILIQESEGKAVIELVPVKEPLFERADNRDRMAMIQQVQGLRLLIWLMRQDNLRASLPNTPHLSTSSKLVLSGLLNDSQRRKAIQEHSMRQGHVPIYIFFASLALELFDVNYKFLIDDFRADILNLSIIQQMRRVGFFDINTGVLRFAIKKVRHILRAPLSGNRHTKRLLKWMDEEARRNYTKRLAEYVDEEARRSARLLNE